MLNSIIFESGCIIRTQDDLTQDISITVIEGPNSDNLSLTYSSNIEEHNCIELGSNYDQIFDQSFPVAGFISPSSYTINTTNNPDLL